MGCVAASEEPRRRCESCDACGAGVFRVCRLRSLEIALVDAMEAKERYLRKEDEFLEHLKIAASDLHVGRVIGRGSSSEVCRASWLGCEVAVKVLHLHQDFQFRTFKSHALELEILMRLPHSHVVQLLGYHVDPGVVCIVMEYMETSLAEVIADRKRISSRPFSSCEALDIITKVALGMRFLHSRRITHGCLSTGIVLMNVHPQGKFDVKIGGFSFSHYTDSLCIPLNDHFKFMSSADPQAGELRSSGQVQKFRNAGDVYQFARICNEILTGRKSWNKPGLPPDDVIDHGLQQLLFKCRDRKPESRPDFVEICKTLAQIQAVRTSALNRRTVTEDSALQWSTYGQDEDDTCVEIATICKTLPNHLSINAADVEWKQLLGQGAYSKLLQQLLCKWWDRKPERRPDFVEICKTLAQIQAVRNSVLNRRTVTEDSALQWSTYGQDEDDTCVEIATIFKTLPDYLSINPADVEWRQLIGQGGYSKVYEVNWHGCTFAVKRFKFLSVSLREELDFLITLQHPHVARLIGLSLDDNGGWVMMERMDMDLRQLIDSRMQQKKARFSWTPSAPFCDLEVWELCHKIALGMNFLHSKQTVHRDIKAANVLVHDRHGRFYVKIADFGVSYRIGNPNVAGCAGTGLWRAPEILKGEKLTEEELKKTDVYSYAMTCYEIITGSYPFEGEVVDALSCPLRIHVHKEDVIRGCRPKLPAGLNLNLVKLITDCWQDNPSERPDFAKICDVFASNPLANIALSQSRGVALCEYLRRILLSFI